MPTWRDAAADPIARELSTKRKRPKPKAEKKDELPAPETGTCLDNKSSLNADNAWMTETDDVVLTAEEKRFFPFFPPADGGIVPPEHVRMSLEAKGLVALNKADGRYWVTVRGDQVRQGVISSRVEG